MYSVFKYYIQDISTYNLKNAIVLKIFYTLNIYREMFNLIYILIN